MNRFIWLLLCAVFLLPGTSLAVTNGPPSAPLARFTCSGSSCTGVPNDASNTYFATISSQTAGLALDATIQSVLATLQAPLTFNLPTNAATATNQTTANGYLSTLATASASQATGAKQDTGNTSLASILTKLNAGIAVTGTFWQATQPISAASLPLPTGASSGANQTNVQSAPGTPQTTAVTIQGNASGVPVPISGTVTSTPSGTQTVGGAISLLPTSSSANGIAPIASTAAESSHVLKSSAGNLYGVSVVPTATGYMMVFDATSAPADGAVTPKFCLPVSANSAGNITARNIPASFATGIVVVFSTTGCFTKTASATAMFTGMVQ